MAGGVVFKQRYKSMNEKKTPMLNGKHLMYIATRTGAIHNKDCAFGLFGKLPFMEFSENIDNLQTAHTMITSVSRRRTIYRAIISVDDVTAKNHSLYDRAVWQELVSKKINVIAKEMDIDRNDFCWAASMHYEKGHPHVHIMYWDNGSKVRQEYVPAERFEIMAEHVRADFGREVYKEEISERRDSTKEIIDEARLELISICKEQNVADALNLKNVSAEKLNDIGQRLYDLVITCPKKGSLKYAYLPEEYKKQLDTMISEMMKLTDFRKLLKQYIKLTDEVSEFYGNGEEKAEYNRSQSLKKLNTALGNEVMDYIRSYKKELEESTPAEFEALKVVIQDDALGLLRNNTNFTELQNMLPKHRTPLREIMTDDFKNKKDEVVHEILSDIRVRTKIWAYLKSEEKQSTGQSTNATPGNRGENDTATYSQIIRTIDDVVMETLYKDSGYEEQWKTDMAVNMLIQVFGSSSQGLNQQRSQHQMNKVRSKDISKTALRDIKKRQEQQGWESEL